MSALPQIREDKWVWGREKIVWGFEPTHQYTFKILEPKVGREGCLSLQYHHHKSESWLVLRGAAWILLIADGRVCTRVMRAGSIQNLPAGVIHRITSLTVDTQIAEPSTPDAHAADKSKPKDVVRLHCYHGRPVVAPRDEQEGALVREALQLTETAMEDIAAGRTPAEHNLAWLVARGAFQLV